MTKLAILAALASAASVASADIIPNRYIVKLKKGASLQSLQSLQTEVQSLASTFNSRESSLSGVTNAVDKTIDISDEFRAITGEFTPEFVEELKTRGDVEYVENEEELHIMGSQRNPPSWGLPRVSQRSRNLSADYTFPNAGGRGVTVYVIDSGIDVSHPDFGGRARWGTAACPGCRQVDDNGHGTHCAGTVGGQLHGVAKSVSLVSVKVCNSQGRCPSTIQGIEWVARNAVPGRSVASMSLGGARNQATNDAVAALVNKGIVVVAAAGNDSRDACNTSPCTGVGVVCVGSTDRNDRLSNFSNYGRCVTMLAPGTDITSAWIGGGGRTDTISGTSMATPHVAGAAALLLSQERLTPAQVTARLIEMSTKNAISGVRGSPNRLLFNGGAGGSPAPRPTTTSFPRPTATTRPAPRPTTTGICTPYMRLIDMC